MGVKPSILFGQVFHKRFSPKINSFKYGMFYLSIPLSHLKDLPLATNRFSSLSFYTKDHGERDGSDLETWIRKLLSDHDIDYKVNGDVVLVTMPRVLGYVFNPVSFWMCFDDSNNLLAVLCEVNNTFGESHAYLCFHDDHAPIKKDDIIIGKKVFHVSPFLPCEGDYQFRFDYSISNKNCGFYINYHDANGSKQLVTSLTGELNIMNDASLNRAFWRYPLITLKAIFLIHWQALKIVFKGIKYITKPQQIKEKVTRSYHIKKT